MIYFFPFILLFVMVPLVGIVCWAHDLFEKDPDKKWWLWFNGQ